MMIGQIWAYDAGTQDGLIIGRDNQEYAFSDRDYSGNLALKEGNMVDFRIDGRQAREIRLLTLRTGLVS
jgi:hypothetical protein